MGEHKFMDQIKRNRNLYLIIFQWLIILIGYALLWNRIRFGIDFTDESWYVAEPYIVANGAIPYVNNWTQTPGFTLPLALLFKLYVMIIGGTEGIVLYSRVLYAVVSFAVYTASTFIIVRRTRQLGAFIAIFPLLFLYVHSRYDLTYNTMGFLYLLIGCVLLFFLTREDDCEEKKEAAASIISGIIVARAIIASPSVLAAWVGILIILAVRKKRSQLLRFIAGNVMAAVLVIGWCCIRGGISGFLNGMRVFLTETSYFQIERRHTFRDDVTYVFNYCKPLWGVLILLVVLRLLWKKKWLSAEKWYARAVIIICAACFLIGIAKGVYSGSYTHFIRYGWFEAILMALFAENVDKDKKSAVIRFAWISGLYFSVYILTSATTISSFGKREYWLIIPVVLGCLSWYFVLNSRLSVVIAVFSVNLLLGFLLIKHNYIYVFRDQPIANLTTKVDYGIWKGCYTTPERAENVKLLEQYIRSITDEESDVLFLDQVCFAYLMTEGKACTPATHDPMSFTYKVNTPEVMYEYFESVDRMPNKIIYIDFGRDKELSIDSDWKFNEFVNGNYELVETYDTNPEITDKFAEGAINTSSFFVKYYKKRE